MARQYRRWLSVVGAFCTLFLISPSFAGESPYNPQGNASAHFYCSSDPAQSTIFFSSAFDVSAGTDAAKVSDGFKQSLADEYAYDGDVYCFGKFKTLDAAQAGQKKRVTDVRAANKAKVVETGWTYASAAAVPGTTSTGASAAPAASNNSGAQSAAQASAAPASAPALSTTLAVRMLQEVDSGKYSPGTQYRGVVTKAADSGNGTTIPAGSMALVVLMQGQSGWAAHLNSITVKGQPMNVSSGPANVMGSAQSTATSAVSSVTSAIGGFGFGHKKPKTPSGAEAVASGERVFLPPGTQLEFALNGVSPGSAGTSWTTAGMPNMAQPGGGMHPYGAGAPGMNSAASSSAGASMPVGNLTAKITETLLGPKTTSFVVSPDGGHYAAFSMHGSREVVVIDGVDGPEFDHATADQFGGHGLDVVFTPDGKHSAYVAQRADDLIMVRDNKEAFVVVNVGPKSVKGVQPINQSGKHGWDIGGPKGSEPSHVCIISPNGAHTAVIVVDSSSNPASTYMLLDGVRSPAYATIDANQVAFVGEKLVYAAQTRDQQWHMVVNDKPGPGYGSIQRLTLTFDDMHYAFMAQNGGGHQVVLDGVPGPIRPHAGNGIQYLTLASTGRCAYVWDKPTADPHGGGAQELVVDEKEVSESIQPFATEDRSLSNNSQIYVLFSPDGKKFAYAKRIPGGAAAVIDGKVGRAYDTIGVISFSPDSGHALFVGNRKQNFVVVDGNELEGFNSVRGFVWSKQGGRLGFVAYGQDGNHLVVDGKKTQRYYSIDNTFSFSPDSKHYVYSACTMYLKCVVVMDGNETAVPAVAQFGTRGQPHFEFPSIFWSEDSSRLAYAYSKSDGTSGTVFTVNGQEVMHNTGTYEFPGFSPDSRHFATFYWTGHAYALFLDGKSSAPYEDLLEVNRNIAKFENAHTYRFLGIKNGSVYRVTVDLGT